MATRTASVPEYFRGRPEEQLRKLAQALNLALDGKTNNTDTITLTANATSTVVSKTGVTSSTVVHLTPLSATAASANVWVSATTDSYTINHDSTTDTDRTFGVILVG